MLHAERRAHRVQLTAANRQLIVRGTLLLEDALRTASLPGSSRPLFIRSLVLDAIDSRLSPAALALQIEAKVQQLANTAVYALSPGARQAAAVYFLDDSEPAVQLALQLVSGRSANVWFWPLAVPGWQPSLPLARSLRLIMRQLLQNEAGPANVARLVAAAHARGRLAPILDSLSPVDGQALLRAFGWTAAGSAAVTVAPPAAAGKAPALPPAWEEICAQRLSVWGSDDVRLRWLVGVALTAPEWHRLASAFMPGQIRAEVAQLVQSVRPPDFAPDAGSRIRPAAASSAQIQPPAAAPQPDAEPLVRPVSPATPDPLATAVAAPPGIQPEKPLPAVGPQTYFDGLPTVVGGLFFVIPVLQRLGIASFLSDHPALAEAGLPWQIMHLLCRRLQAPDSDAIWAALPALPPLPDLPYTTPRRWQRGIWQDENSVVVSRGRRQGSRLLLDSSGRLPLACWQHKAPLGVRQLCQVENVRRADLPFDLPHSISYGTWAWLTAVRRWSRRLARLGLVNLVQRPATIVITPTHLDIFFDHNQADIAVRRAGLDLDPGWVPWLGRVVKFHYQYGEQAA